MLIVLVAALAMAQSEAMAQAEAPDTAAGDLTAPPKLNRARAILCSCANAAEPDYRITGLVVDAELFLGADKRSAADRQATIFNVISAEKNGEPVNISERTKVFHGTNTNKCGVTFDYGKQYMVYAHKIGDDAYETDYCLMNAAFGEETDKTENAGDDTAEGDESP